MSQRWWGPIAVAALTGCPSVDAFAPATDTSSEGSGGSELGDPSASDTGLSTDPSQGSHGETGAEACPATHACIAAPPPDWLGPVALLDAAVRLPCPASHPDPVLAAFDDLVAAPASCGCSCDAGSLCGELVAADLQSACEYPTEVLATTPFPDVDVCTAIPPLAGEGLHLAFEPDASVGCTPESKGTVSDPLWSRSLQLCGTSTISAGCASDELCAPLPDDGVTQAFCIARVGEHGCPAEFPVAQIGWTGVVDERGCSPCECGAPGDTPTPVCNATVRLSSSPDCSDDAAPELEVGAFTCVLTDGLALGYLRYTDVTANVPACKPSGGEPIGAAEPTDPVTICCAG